VRRSDRGRYQSDSRSAFWQTQVKRARASQVLRPPAFGYQGATLGTRATELYCEAVPLERLAERYGTPLYVYSVAMIRARLNAFAHSFRSIPHTLCYSVKANSTLAILRMVAGEGAGFDVVSGGELQRVLRVNRKAAGKVVFSGVGKNAAEMELALRSGILLFNIESGGSERSHRVADYRCRYLSRGARARGRSGLRIARTGARHPLYRRGWGVGNFL